MTKVQSKTGLPKLGKTTIVYNKEFSFPQPLKLEKDNFELMNDQKLFENYYNACLYYIFKISGDVQNTDFFEIECRRGKMNITKWDSHIPKPTDDILKTYHVHEVRDMWDKKVRYDIIHKNRKERRVIHKRFSCIDSTVDVRMELEERKISLDFDRLSFQSDEDLNFITFEESIPYIFCPSKKICRQIVVQNENYIWGEIEIFPNGDIYITSGLNQQGFDKNLDIGFKEFIVEYRI